MNMTKKNALKLFKSNGNVEQYLLNSITAYQHQLESKDIIEINKLAAMKKAIGACKKIVKNCFNVSEERIK
jgi:hypothetical protein